MVAPVSFPSDDSSFVHTDESVSSSASDIASEASSTCSARKRRANQRNARKSTGPRTEEGKARSSKNATTLGLFCADLLLPGENPELLEHLRNTMLLELNPRTMTQLMLADRVIACAWRLRRIFPAEQMLAHVATLDMTLQREFDSGKNPPEINSPDDVLEHPAYASYRHKVVKKHLRESGPPEGVALSMMLLGPQSAAMERLGRYEQRLVNQSNRALAELRKLQGDKNHKNIRSDEYIDELFEEGMCPFVSNDFLGGLKIQIDKLKDIQALLKTAPPEDQLEDGNGDEDEDAEDDEADLDEAELSDESADDQASDDEASEPTESVAEPIVQNEATDEKPSVTKDPATTYNDPAVQEITQVDSTPTPGQSESAAPERSSPEEPA